LVLAKKDSLSLTSCRYVGLDVHVVHVFVEFEKLQVVVA
jgi:hypothetical protein